MDENKELWNRLIRLGDMMGEGLHHEPEGIWISKEYTKILKILDPEMFVQLKEAKVAKNKARDLKLHEFMHDKKCTCGRSLSQSRSGSLIYYCDDCKNRYKVRTKKTKK